MIYENIAIIGDGGMGTVLGMLLCEKADALAAQAECAHEPMRGVVEARMDLFGFKKPGYQLGRNRLRL